MSNEVSLLKSMAMQQGIDPKHFQGLIQKTVMPKGSSMEEMMAFLVVANSYKLNPLTKEIYAFPSRGGIQPIVSIDGWLKIINNHPQFDGMEFVEDFNESGELVSTTCKMYRKDRGRPVVLTEYLEECDQKTDPWKKRPSRMLRHKAAIQCARYAFNFSGIMDEDEASQIIDVTPQANSQPVEQQASSASRAKQLVSNKVSQSMNQVPQKEPEPAYQEVEFSQNEPQIAHQEEPDLGDIF